MSAQQPPAEAAPAPQAPASQSTAPQSTAPNAAAAHPAAASAAAIALPGGEGGIDLDDLRWSSRLGRVLLPANDHLDLIDPATGKIDAIPGFGGAGGEKGHGDEGTSSCDEGAGFLFAIDHGQQQVHVIDPGSRAILSSAPLADGPDYVRFVPGARELWVTEPEAAQIEIFSLPPGDRPVPARVGMIAVPGGPESLVIDEPRGHAYCNLWKDGTVVLDLKQRAVVATWPNGCSGSRGLVLDAARGFLFVGCAEGRAVVLDIAHDGKLLSSATTALASTSSTTTPNAVTSTSRAARARRSRSSACPPRANCPCWARCPQRKAHAPRRRTAPATSSSPTRTAAGLLTLADDFPASNR